MAAAVRAISLPVIPARLAIPPPARETPAPCVIPLRPWLRRKRRRRLLNEPMLPLGRSATTSSRWELYQFHKRMGTLGIYFDLYPS